MAKKVNQPNQPPVSAVKANPNSRKRMVFLMVLTFFTLVLGVVAVITALRLQELSTTPVAPTAPESRPQAQVVPPAPTCLVSFTVAQSTCGGYCDEDSDCGNPYVCNASSNTCVSSLCPVEQQDSNCQCPPPPSPEEVSCAYKTVYRDTPANTPGNYSLDPSLALSAGERVVRGERLVFAVVLQSDDPSGAADFTDKLPQGLNYVDAVTGCIHSGGIVSCSYSGALPATLSYRVEVAESVAYDATLTNEVDVTDSEGNTSTCSESVRLIPPPTPTPTGTPMPTGTPGPTATPAPTAPPQPTNTPAPTLPPGVLTATPVPVSPTPVPELPQAGDMLPTTILLFMGMMFLLAGIGFLLVL